MKKNSVLKVICPLVCVIPVVMVLSVGCSPKKITPTSQNSQVPTTLTTSTTPTSIPPASTPPATQPTSPTILPPTARVPVVTTVTPPAALIRSRSTLDATQYVVFAWNDLGMHCANPSYDIAVLLPPYNTLWAQVIKRGNPPQIVTSGITVEYSFVSNTYSYGKGQYSQFWDNMTKLFGVSLNKNTGLNLKDANIHNGLTGKMTADNDHFEADGIPLTPINDNGTWNPYQVAQIIVKDAAGRTLASTDAMAPISDEINCAKCHGPDAFNDILVKHDARNGTNLVSQKPVLCASCHGDPALGKSDAGPFDYLSERIHGFHATVNPQPTCYDCHPGASTQCSRSIAHTAADGNCKTCHGDLANVSTSIENGRTPWVSEPKCVTCHAGVAEIDTQTTLYRNAMGHGGVYCASCHSSPHAMVPSSQATDNYQAMQYQGAALPIGSCGACHSSSRGRNNMGEFAEAHAGTNPEVKNAGFICHTAILTNTAKWPHAFQWRAVATQGQIRGGD